ncbi:MAG TPA: helix-turn-helix transcriptional regulator [Nitrospiraceae bacterium]|nr:helix-turn-helix transcriptional regulator [Nitrospiraceae bacterium]
MTVPTTTRGTHHKVTKPGEGGAPRFSFWLFIEALQDANNGEGMSPLELSEEMGASHEAVARWMAGIAVPKAGYLHNAARILHKKPEDFYE